MLALKRAMSIDYEPADGGGDDFADDDDDGSLCGSEGDGVFRRNDAGRSSSPSPRRWRLIGVVLLVALTVVTVSVGKRRSSGDVVTGGDAATLNTGDDSLTCDDPVMALKPESSIAGLESGAVATDHPLCSKLAARVLMELGGSAADAAVAAALCLGVANPASSGMGGGAFVLVHADPSPAGGGEGSDGGMPPFRDERTPATSSAATAATGKVTEVIDCREVAPGAAGRDMYRDAPATASVLGGLAAAVPGELRGLELLHARHGRLPWADVVRPAAELARNGVAVNPNLAREIGLEAGAFRDGGDAVDYGLRQLITKRDNWGRPLQEGDIMKNHRLAETLEAIMEHGSDALYTGKRAEALAQDIRDAGGIVTKEDLEAYRPTLRSPVVAHDVHGFSIVGVPPPSSGGAAIAGAARFLSGFQLPLSSYADTLSVHRFVEACKHVFAIRMSLSDPAYNTDRVQEAVTDLVEGSYMESLRQAHLDNATLPLSRYGGSKWAQLKDTDGAKNASDAQEGDRRRLLHGRKLARRFGYLNDGGTSHFSIVDKDGNAVAMTTSINTYFGSKVVSLSTGIVLSNTMDDFANPGRPNFFGLKPSEANYIQPGKKPLSSMAPTMVFRSTGKDSDDASSSSNSSSSRGSTLGDLVLVVGASGGPKIITAVLQVIVKHVLLGVPLFESIIHPRVHDQLIYHGSASTTTEKAQLATGPLIDVSKRTREALARRGHRLMDVDYAGTVQAITVDLETGKMSAACDVRKGGTPAGY
jgi:gamma-glutamyltranspeptidase